MEIGQTKSTPNQKHLIYERFLHPVPQRPPTPDGHKATVLPTERPRGRRTKEERPD